MHYCEDCTARFPWRAWVPITISRSHSYACDNCKVEFSYNDRNYDKINKNELLFLWESINDLCHMYWNNEVAGLLWYLYGTIHKRYDEDEQSECIIEDCLRLQKEPKYYLDK